MTGSGADALDILIAAMGDLESGPRRTAAEALGERAADLTIDQFHRLLDITTLLLMAANLAEEPNDFIIGADGLILDVVDNLVAPLDTYYDLTQLTREQQQIFAEGTVLLLFPVPLSKRMEPDSEGLEEAKAVLDCLDSEIWLEDRDCELLLDSPGAPPTPDLALRFAQIDPAFGSLLGVVATFAHRDELVRTWDAGTSEYELGGYTPLHLRLETANALGYCRARVEDQARDEGLPGIVALFALSAAGNQEAIDNLTDRILCWKIDGWNVVVRVFLTLIEDEQQEEFKEQFLAADPVPVEIRSAFREEWSDSREGVSTY